MKINWRTTLFSLIAISLLTASVLAFSVSSGNSNAQNNKIDSVYQNLCAKHKPSGSCTAPDTQCVTLVGKDCLFACKVDGTWDDGSYCPNNCHNADACSPY